ncbi:hypothetical protein KR018_004268 [Drosophila ironensis]|nr:hypothetical protein KR018_004268 [Drosophila ironensis]
MAYSGEIRLDNHYGCYRAGETINLNVYFNVKERSLIKAICLKANGYAATSWKQPQNKKTIREVPQIRCESLNFEYRVDYFAKTEYFLGSEASQPQLIEVGTYNYGGHVKLPKNCPGNYDGTCGHIRYMLQVLVYSNSGQPVDILHARELQMFPINNLFQEPRCCEINSYEHTPRFKFWIKPLYLHLQIPRQSYSPGGGISVHVKLHNPEKLLLSEVIYSLVQITTYVGQQKNNPRRKESKVERNTILNSSNVLVNLPRAELENFQHLHMLQVPQTAATLSSKDCACLQLSYEVEVFVRTHQPNRSIVAQIPVIIGNVTPPCPGKLLVRESHIKPTTNASSSFNISTVSLASDFREAQYMPPTNLNKPKNYMSGEKLNFKPRYGYYETNQAQ